MTTQIGLETEIEISGDVSRSDIETLLDRLMDELVSLAHSDCRIEDPALSLDMGRRALLVGLLAEAETFEEAVAVADSSLRAAAHAAGWSTASWRTTRHDAELLSA